MNAIWVATDWHLWDVKHKPQHPFRTNIQLNAMQDECVENIADSDIFIHLGDLCDPASPDAGKLKEFIANIPGYKVLCKGNYDTADDSFYLDAGFNEVCEICKIHNIIFSHKPVKVAPDEINIHGHLHTEKMSCLGYQHINAYATNIGEDQIPHIVELDDLLASATVQKDYPKDHWVIDQKYIDNINKYTSLDGEYFNYIIDLTDRVSAIPVSEASNIIDFNKLPAIRSIAQGRTKRGHLVTLHAQQFAMGNVKYVVSMFKDVLDAAIHIAPYAYDKEQIAKCKTANELIAYFNTLNNAYSTSNGYSGNFYAFANANVSAHFFDKDQIYSKLIPTDLSEDQFAEYISNAISEMDNMLDILLECIKTNYALFGLALSDVNEINVSDINKLIDDIDTNPPKGFIETKADGTKIIHFGKLAKDATMYISKTAQGPGYSAITPSRYLLRANEYKYIIITHGMSTGNRNEWVCDPVTIDNKQFTSIPDIIDYIIKVKENGNYSTKILIMTCNPNMYKFGKKYRGVEYSEYDVYVESAVEVLSPRKELIRILFDWDKYCNMLLEKFNLLKKWTHAYYYDITAVKQLSEHYVINSIAAIITAKNIELTFASNGEFLLCTDTLIEAAISIVLAAHDLIGIINDKFTMSESGNYHWYENIVNGNSGGFLSESIDPFDIAVSEHLEHSRGYESLQECINEATIRLIYGSDRVPKINPIFAHDRTIDAVNFSEATDTLQWENINEVIFDDVSDTEYWEQDDEYEPSHKKTEPMADGKMFVDESTYYRYTYDGKGIYDELRKAMPWEEWKKAKTDGTFSWLPVPDVYSTDGKYQSYFTTTGKATFDRKVLPLIKRYLDSDKIDLQKYSKLDNIAYNDKYQVVISLAAKEPMTEGAIKNIFAKFRKKGDSENHSLRCSKEPVNIKKAYTEWYMGFTVTNMDSEQAKDLAEEFAFWCQQTDTSRPRTYMHITKDDIIKEFGSQLKGEDIANNYLMFPCKFTKNPGAVKTRYGLRYFTDIIDNAIRRVLYDDPKYKYPSYIMTDNIKAGHKYLTGKDMDIQNEAVKEYMRTDDNHPMTRDEKTESFRKYGLNPVGQDPELAKTEKERELERKTEARKKQLAKARKIKKRKARVRKIKSKLPGVKNEEAETVAQASVNIDNDEDKNPIWGDSIRFFNHPDQYTETNINETFADYKFHLDDHVTFMDRMNENSSTDDSLYPVYVMVMHSGTLLANTIKKVTNSHFSHCTISFDSSMKNMYSFGRKADVNPFVGGFTKDSITNSVYQKHEVPYALYVVPVTKDELDAMKKRLDYFIANKSKFSYDFTGLIKNYFGIADNPEYRYFCSRFVADILNAGRPKSNPYVVEPSLMRPEDFTTTNFAIYVTGGYLASYKPKFVDDVTKRILRAEKIRRMKEANANIEFDVNTENPYSESILKYQLTKMDESAINDFVRYLSSFKIHLDNDGNVLISRREYDQLSVHFHNSLKIIKACETAGNVEGVKEELYKIKYMIDLIQSYYLTPKSKNMRDKTNSDLRKEMMDLRSVMINAMGQHIKYVTVHDPKWNFQQGYAASKYSNDQLIPKSVITAIGKTVVTKL